MKMLVRIAVSMMIASSAMASGFRSAIPPAGVPISSPLDASGNIEASIQDQHTRTGDAFFSQRIGEIATLSTNAVIDEYAIVATVGHSISNGEQLVLYDIASGRLYVGNVLDVVTNDVTLDTPLNYSFPSASTAVARRIKEMNVDGSTNRQTFVVTPPVDVEIDITRIMFQIICDDPPAMDDFGDIENGLTRGVVLRAVNGTTVNYFNVKTNGELVNLMYDVSFYDQTGPQGVNGIGGRLTYGGSSKHGVVIRLGQGDSLEAIIQDDLTDFTLFRMMATFHEVGN